MLNAKFFPLAILIMVAGCATQSPKVAKAEPDVQCTTQQLTGSQIHRTVCTTKAQRDAMAADTESVREAMQSPGDPCRVGKSC